LIRDEIALPIYTNIYVAFEVWIQSKILPVKHSEFLHCKTRLCFPLPWLWNLLGSL